ncbi:MAG TPA: DUF2283 domain-containing protein [Tepidisphaeraceae bacterium]|jgi:uncharacterized protein YuzE
MKKPSLQITYRNGKPFAAYLYVGGGDRKVAKSRERGPVVIDFDADGNVLGVELHTITAATVEELKKELAAFRFNELSDNDLKPLLAA